MTNTINADKPVITPSICSWNHDTDCSAFVEMDSAVWAALLLSADALSCPPPAPLPPLPPAETPFAPPTAALPVAAPPVLLLPAVVLPGAPLSSAVSPPPVLLPEADPLASALPVLLLPEPEPPQLESCPATADAAPCPPARSEEHTLNSSQ